MSMPTKPPNECINVLYNNYDHFLNQELVDFLATNQDHYGIHIGKGYQGCVFAVTEDINGKGRVRWYEEVYGLGRHMTYGAWDISKLVEQVTEDFGYA